MRSGQSVWGIRDGDTLFYRYVDGTALPCDDIVAASIGDDGTVGQKLFYEARGYTVSSCYAQYTDNNIAGGFSFTQYEAEIDAGHPVMIALLGLTVVGYGYDDATSTVYLNDPLNNTMGSMTWGGTYLGMSMDCVSIVIPSSTPIDVNTLTVVGYGNSVGTVTSSPPGIDCYSDLGYSSSVDCMVNFAPNTFVTLTAVPSSHTQFTGWDGDCTGTGPCYFSMYTPKSVTAEFSLVRYTLTVSGTGFGTVTSDIAGIDCGLDCTEDYDYSTPVKLTAVAAPGYLFTGWGGACSGLKFCYVTMYNNRSVTATFTAIPPGTYPLTVVKGGTGSGTATSAPAGIDCGTDCWEFYATNTAVKLTATAAAGSTFVGWSGACGSMDFCYLKMGAKKYVTANFMLTPAGTYPLIVANKGAGKGTVTSTPAGISCWSDCYEFYTSGTLVKLVAVAAPGSTFTGWSGGCGGTANCWVTMSQARFVTANFAIEAGALSPLDDLSLFRDPFQLFIILTKPLEMLLLGD